MQVAAMDFRSVERVGPSTANQEVHHVFPAEMSPFEENIYAVLI